MMGDPNQVFSLPDMQPKHKYVVTIKTKVETYRRTVEEPLFKVFNTLNEVVQKGYVVNSVEDMKKGRDIIIIPPSQLISVKAERIDPPKQADGC